jgi:hypothetical protein
MGKKDNRRTRKMLKKIAQVKKKLKIKARIAAGKKA